MTDGKRCRCRGHGSPEIIDPCIRELVDCLNRHGVRTDGSCCGHGVGPGDILLASDAITLHPAGNGMWILKLGIKPIVLPYEDATGNWEDEYPTGGRNLGVICNALLQDEEQELRSSKDVEGKEC